MRIKRLELKNFRGFEELTINFPEDSNVAVFVGVNGAGKTSVLEAIRVILYSFFLKILGESKYNEPNFKLLSVSDIKKGYDDLSIFARLNYLNIKVDENLSRFVRGGATADLGDLAKNYELARNAAYNQAKKKLPITLFYYTERAVSETPPLNAIRIDGLNPFYNYRDFLGNYVSLDSFFMWFRSFEDYENEQRLNSDTNFREKGLEAVRSAISTFLPNFKNPRVQRQPQEELIVEKNGEKLSISNLSHGERLMFAMVGDIARRLSIANPGLDDPLQGEGVVLIDEIELHLHPGWQRKIVPLLTKTFPNIQFIITTHSPQVISTVNKDSVFLLENFQLKKVPATLGRDSNSILEEIFLIPERPEGINKDLEKVYELMNDPDKIGEAKALLQEIEQKYEVSRDEEVMQAKMHLEFLEG